MAQGRVFFGCVASGFLVGAGGGFVVGVVKMRGWVPANKVKPGKYWACTTAGLRLQHYTAVESDPVCGDDWRFWLRGKPAPDDPRWLLANEAISEWGVKGGSKGWWVLNSITGAVVPVDSPQCSDVMPHLSTERLIPRGRPPVPLLVVVEHPSAMMCEHANENPNFCFCPPNCYCRTRTCKNKQLNQSELRVKQLPVCPSCGTEQEYPNRIQPVISMDSHREKLEAVVRMAKAHHISYPTDTWGNRFSEVMDDYLQGLIKEPF